MLLLFLGVLPVRWECTKQEFADSSLQRARKESAAFTAAKGQGGSFGFVQLKYIGMKYEMVRLVNWQVIDDCISFPSQQSTRFLQGKSGFLLHQISEKKGVAIR